MIYTDIPGGAELLAWFGQEPTFHDAEIISLFLNRSGVSELKLHGWINTGDVGPDGSFVLAKQALVTFSLEKIMDLQLDGFSAQNVISGLELGYATDRGRSNCFPLPQDPHDIDIELMPCYGLDGFIRAKKVTVSFVPGQPKDR
ncbi:Imm50 family immunity protein [Pleomorphomonas oryzae]|uniref:Imm50 family immunity protein n=1 Tax=Pleomorphomonas oryzae TaxID=261934 RepID=UPI00041A6C6D|nr:Imm50 family immunity protein [Pleomorphomonas oryzae]